MLGYARRDACVLAQLAAGHVRWIWLSVYLVAGVIALVLGAGAASALIGAVVAVPVVGGLELWFRRQHSERPGNT
jgi:hypothetical protein